MRYEEFKIALKQELEKIATNTKDVCFRSAQRNNGTMKDVIRVRESGTAVAFVIDLEDVYERYSETGDMEGTISFVWRLLADKKKFDLQNLIGTWERVCGKLSKYID